MKRQTKRTMYLMGMKMHFLTSSESDGYFLCDAILLPDAGAPPNRHPDDAESFFVREGTVEFTVDGVVTNAGPGEFVKVPKGGVHSFQNTSESEARMLILNVPGTIHENVFKICGTDLEVGTDDWPINSPKLDMEWVAKVCKDEGLEILA